MPGPLTRLTNSCFLRAGPASRFLKKKYVTAYWMGCTPEEAEEQYLPESEANDVESRFPLE